MSFTYSLISGNNYLPKQSIKLDIGKKIEYTLKQNKSNQIYKNWEKRLTNSSIA